MPKILFVATHRPNRSPSQRFRFEQYLTFLKEKGWDCEYSFLISEKADQVFYKQGFLLKKAFIILKGFFIRMSNYINASNYDIIFIQREAFLTGTTLFERRFAKSKAKLVFDFDDSIWLANVSEANKSFNWMKNPGKTKEIIAISDLVFAGNQYLKDYAAESNSNVKIIPTTIDTEEYLRIDQEAKDQICIGWSGSITTIQHFEYVLSSLSRIKQKYGDRVKFKVIGDRDYKNDLLDIIGLPWEKETEVKELSSFDIGIMPLPNDEWANGKCGLKGLQYMALEIPTIMSPVGVNKDIIEQGVNGFLADSENEWVDTISLLIEGASLRKKVGEQARLTVEKNYSVKSQENNYLNYFNKLIG